MLYVLYDEPVSAFIRLRIALHMSGSEDTNNRFWFLELMGECENVLLAFCKHFKADLFALWRRF